MAAAVAARPPAAEVVAVAAAQGLPVELLAAERAAALAAACLELQATV